MRPASGQPLRPRSANHRSTATTAGQPARAAAARRRAPTADGRRGRGADEPMPNLERLVAEAMALAATAGGDGRTLAELVNRYWRLVPDEELGRPDRGRDVRRHAGRTWSWPQQRLPGQLKLRHRAGPPTHTALQIVTDDMPFLVDSVTAAVTAPGSTLNLLVHPLVVVRREAAGRAASRCCADVEPDDAGAGRPGRELDAASRSTRCATTAASTALRNDAAPGAHRRPRGGRGLAQDAPAGARAGRRAGRAPRCRCRTRTSPTPSSCCAGWPTTTSPSSATASTGS